MTKKPKLVPFGKTPEVVKTRPIPPKRITKKGHVALARTPEISETDVSVPTAVGEAIEALSDAGSNGEVSYSLVLSWLQYIQATAEFLDR